MPPDKNLPSFKGALCPLLAFVTNLTATPVASNDTFSVDEDGTLTISKGRSILSATFEAGSLILSPTWEYLDRIENENGFNQTYPLDANGLTWNSPQFEILTSTNRPWSTGNAPFQGGVID